MEPLTAPLFRGATRVPMAFGVPIEPLVLGVTPFLVVTLLLWIKLGFAALVCLFPAIFVVLVMRDLSKSDNQFLTIWLKNRQEIGWLKENKHSGAYIVPPQEYRNPTFFKDEVV